MLKEKILNKQGYSMLMASLVGVSILSAILFSTTNWYLSLKNNNKDVDSIMIGKIAALNKWDEIIHQNLKEKENNVNKKVDSIDKDGNHITVEYGKKGAFKNGTCNTSLSQEDINKSFQACTPVTVTVKDKDNKKTLYTLKSINVMSSTYAYPVGTIIPYTGKFADIPDNWHLCDGTNGTPNLNDKYLKGTIYQSEIGTTGGNNEYTIKQENLPPATVSIYANDYLAMGTHAYPMANPVHTVRTCDANTSLSLRMHYLATYIHFPDWKGKPLPVAPLHQTVAYIMKMK